MIRKIYTNIRTFVRKQNLLFLVFVVRFYGKQRNREEKGVRFLGSTITIVDGPSFLWQFKDIFVDEVYAFLSIQEKPVVYDCGANIGLVSLYCKRQFPDARVIAFEADARIAQVCKNNLVQNGFADVEVVDRAVWTDNGGVSFVADGADGGSAHVMGASKWVQSVRLRDYIQREVTIDLLKIDIEGSERAVLEDCADVLKNVRHLFVEYHSFTQETQDLSCILRILEDAGFRYYLAPIIRRRKPLVYQAAEFSMDMQVNIFAYRM